MWGRRPQVAGRAGARRGSVLTTSLVDPVDFHRDVVPRLLAERGAAVAAALADEAPLAIRVVDAAWTYRVAAGTVVVDDGVAPDAGAVIELSGAAWSDLVELVRTVPALMISGDIAVTGSASAVDRWERPLRMLWQGMPIVEPSAALLHDGVGRPIDIARTFTLDDTDDDLGAFLRAVGVMRVRGVFGADEIAALNDEVDRLAALARPGDDRSWWAQNADGNDVLCRLVYASERSPLIASVDEDPRLGRLAALVRGDLRPATDRMEGTAVLLKPPGKLRGLANIPWHTDCGLGGHRVLCPSVAIGIQLTSATPETGCFEAIAGTHGASCRIPTAEDLATWPHLLVPTEPGDVTVHIADLLHASPRPTGDGGRRTLYVTFHPPTLFEHIGPGEAYNDLIRRRTASQVADAVGRRP